MNAVSTEWYTYRRLLLDKRHAVLSGLGARASHFHSGYRVSDEDLAQHSHEEFVTLRLSGIDYLQLRQVQEALDRLQAGDYGVCQSCDAVIPEKRLRAVPWTCYCVRCQEDLADRPFRDQEVPEYLPEADGEYDD